MIIHALLNLYTCIIDREEIPNSFKLAVKIPIPKGNKKGKMFDDHRGISLLSCINKVLERIVLSRLQRQQTVSIIHSRVDIKNTKMLSRHVLQLKR